MATDWLLLTFSARPTCWPLVLAQQLPPDPDWADLVTHYAPWMVYIGVGVIVAVSAVSFLISLLLERRERQAKTKLATKASSLSDQQSAEDDQAQAS